MEATSNAGTKHEVRTMGKYDKYEVRLGDEGPMPEFTFTSHGIGSSPIGDIVAIKAKSKNGKTFLAAILASVILGAKFDNLEPALKYESKILFFDTEQNRPNVQALLQRILILRGWGEERNDRLHVYSLREMHVIERLRYISRKIDALRPTAVFIDGLADLAFDFNDIEQSMDIIVRISQLASTLNCTIFFILHTNKNDNNMKGHLGTLATQKCSDVFHVEKDENDIFNVTETDCRNIPIKDFHFKIDDDGIPYPVQKNTEGQNDDNNDSGNTEDEPNKNTSTNKDSRKSKRKQCKKITN